MPGHLKRILEKALHGGDDEGGKEMVFDLPNEEVLQRRCLARKAMAVLELTKQYEVLFCTAVETKVRQIDIEMANEWEAPEAENSRHQQARRDIGMMSADGLLGSVADMLGTAFEHSGQKMTEAVETEDDSSPSLYKTLRTSHLRDQARPRKRKIILCDDTGDDEDEEPPPLRPYLLNSSSFLDRDEEIPSRLPIDHPSEPKSASSPLPLRHRRATRSSTVADDQAISSSTLSTSGGHNSRLTPRLSRPEYDPRNYYEPIGALGAKPTK